MKDFWGSRFALKKYVYGKQANKFVKETLYFNASGRNFRREYVYVDFLVRDHSLNLPMDCN